MLNRDFHELEHETWSQKASSYDRLFADVSGQAIAPLLDSLGNLDSKRLVDVACGTGHLVGDAMRRGIVSEGVDFAEPMVEVARANYPDARFSVADAANLPYDDASIDAVTCAFGLPHIARPQAAGDEAFRVLKPGGRFAFTLWFGPDEGGDLAAISRAALNLHATKQVMLPPTWTILRFADEAACDALVRQAGFARPSFQRLDSQFQTRSAQRVLDFAGKLSLRTATIINAQPESVRTRIYQHILHEAEARRHDGVITLAWPALLTIAQKPI
jgi:ubiquinone/menaquinone biosynthesis C-methylase UbiE